MSFCDKIQFCVLKFYGMDVNILESWRRLVDDFANNIVNRDGEILVTFNFSLFGRGTSYQISARKGSRSSGCPFSMLVYFRVREAPAMLVRIILL